MAPPLVDPERLPPRAGLAAILAAPVTQPARKPRRATEVTVVTVGAPDIGTAVYHALRVHRARQTRPADDPGCPVPPVQQGPQ